MNTPWYRPTRVLATRSAAPTSAIGTARGSGRSTILDSLPPVVQHRARARRRGSPSATVRSSRRSIRTPSSSATGATASSTPSTSSRKRGRLRGRRRGVPHRRPPCPSPTSSSTRSTARSTSPSAAVGRPPALYRVTYTGDRVDDRAVDAETLEGVRGPRRSAQARGLPRPRRPEGRRGRPGRTSRAPTATLRFAARGPRSSSRTRPSRGVTRRWPSRDPQASLEALLALTRVSGAGPRPSASSTDPDARPRDQGRASSTRSTGWRGSRSRASERLDLVRVYSRPLQPDGTGPTGRRRVPG